MELKTYLSILVRRWWVVLLLTVAIGGASVYLNKYIPQKYQAEAGLRIITPLGGQVGDVSYQTTYATRLINTYADVASNEQVLDEVKQKLNLSALPDVTVKIVPDSEIIQIVVVASSPSLAAKTANAIADAVIARSGNNAATSAGDSEELKILMNRQAVVQKELDQVKQDYNGLVEAYARTTAAMTSLDGTIRLKESTYQTLLNQRQQAVINEAVAIYLSTKTPAKTTKEILTAELATLDTELATLRQQYQELSTNSSQYNEQVVLARQSVQDKENTYNNLLSQIDSVRIADSKRVSAGDITISSRAIPPAKSTGPGTLLVVGLGVLCGLIAGILLALLLNNLDTRVLTADQIQRIAGSPVIGRLPSMARNDRNAPFDSDDLTIQRAFWSLCTKILALHQSRQVKTILIASPNPAEGKSTVVMAVAKGLARANRKVLVVDADLREPSQHKLFSAPGELGLVNFLRGEKSLDELIQPLEGRNIHFLPSGLEPDDPATLLHATQIAGLFDKISGYDVVLFDSPALLAVPDAYHLASQVDGIILVVQRKRTTVGDIQAVMNQLEDVKDKILGTVINRYPVERISGYYQRKSKSTRTSKTSSPAQGATPAGPQ